MRDTTLAKQAQELSLLVSDEGGVVHVALAGFHEVHPKWCPRFMLEVSVNGAPAEQVEREFVGAISDGSWSSSEFHCGLPAFEYTYDPEAEPLEAVRVEVADASMRFVAEAEVPSARPRLLLVRDRVVAGEFVQARLTPAPPAHDGFTVLQGIQRPLRWRDDEPSIEIPSLAAKGEHQLELVIPGWVPLITHCEGPRNCHLSLDRILGDSEWRHRASATVTVL